MRQKTVETPASNWLDNSDEEEVDIYWQAVIDSDYQQLLDMHMKLKDKGFEYMTEWIEFIENRTKTAQMKIKQKQDLVKRVRYLTHQARRDHATAIIELREAIISEENPSVGIIPVEE